MIQKLLSRIKYLKKVSPEKAYNMWAVEYDNQTYNAIAFLSTIILNEFLSQISMENKIVIDIGCGTGTNWEKIMSLKPAQLIGYDVSKEMLKVLRRKFPNAKTFLIENDNLDQSTDCSCDVIISSLVLGYIKNFKKALLEWNRVLKKDGAIVLTDFHPVEAEKGGKRCFTFQGETIVIKNYVHSIDTINQFARHLNWELVSFKEASVDERTKEFFKRSNSLDVYEKMQGSKLVYGFLFRKK